MASLSRPSIDVKMMMHAEGRLACGRPTTGLPQRALGGTFTVQPATMRGAQLTWQVTRAECAPTSYNRMQEPPGVLTFRIRSRRENVSDMSLMLHVDHPAPRRDWHPERGLYELRQSSPRLSTMHSYS
jgi:hypothetical protein